MTPMIIAPDYANVRAVNPALSSVTVAQFGLGIQAWLGADPCDPDRVQAVTWPSQPTEKPRHGFLTSSWDDVRRTSSWIELHATTPRATEKRRLHLLQPDPHAVLYVVHSPGDFDALAQAYPQRNDNPRNPTVCPHWRHLATEGPFDAIHMTAEAVADKNHGYAHGWAVESRL